MSSNIQVYNNEQKLERLKEEPKILNRIYKAVLQKDTDYGIIPGTPKPSLWKPGAELLAKYFELVSGDPIVESVEQLDKPYFAYVVKQRFFDREGKLLGTGVGSANTGETRYALIKVYKNDYDAMTDEEKEKILVRKGKEVVYYRHRDADEVCTLQNTVLKMASKRAFVDGVLKITGADRIFTQDVDEENESEKEKGKIDNAKPVGKSEAKVIYDGTKLQ